MLKEVTIRNFQSIRDITYNFSEGLNVIIAENGTGKSVFNKLINFMVNYNKYNVDERKQFIRFNTPKSDIFFSSDDCSYWVEIYLNKINYYRLSGTQYVFESNHIPNDLVSMLSLLIASNGFIGNLITSKQSKLLVDSDDEINTQVLGLVVNDEKSDLLIETCEERFKEINSNLRSNIAVRDSLERELSKVEVYNYSHVESAVNRVYGVIDFVDNLVSISEVLSNVNPTRKIDYRLEGALEALSSLESLRADLDKIVPTKDTNTTIEDLNNLSNLVKLSSDIDDLLYKKSLVKELPKIRFNENVLGLLSRLEVMKSSLDKVTRGKKVSIDKLHCLEELLPLQDKLTEALELSYKIREQRDLLSRLQVEIDSYGGEVYDCPIYGSIKFVNEECIRINN